MAGIVNKEYQKSCLIYVVCAIFSSLHSVTKKIAAMKKKSAKLLGGKIVNELI